jgi:hypothetical protein
MTVPCCPSRPQPDSAIACFQIPVGRFVSSGQPLSRFRRMISGDLMLVPRHFFVCVAPQF